MFIKFYHATTYIEQGKLEAYLAKMAVNKSKDYLRSWAYRKIQLRHTLKSVEVEIKDSLVQIVGEQ